MGKKKPKFDVEKAKQRILKGRRKNWWRRLGGKKSGFWYKDKNDNKIEAENKISRIEDLVIPPAWKYVRISPSAQSNLQAVGMDTSGRVQYLYSQIYREKRERQKFKKIESFGIYLPNIRLITNEHIELRGFPKEKVLAVMMRLINSLYMRIGSRKSVRKYRTYGITTLGNKHLHIKDNDELIFNFVGKHQVKQRKILADEKLAGILRELLTLGKKRKLFEYLDEQGNVRPIKPKDINRYIKDITAPDFSAKDFRTWGGTLQAALELSDLGSAENEKEIKKNVVKAVKRVADKLGNTPKVCRQSYIHPSVIKSYESGLTLEEFTPRSERRIKKHAENEPEESALMRLFEKFNG